jgi:hypothetical protein
MIGCREAGAVLVFMQPVLREELQRSLLGKFGSDSSLEESYHAGF